MEIGRRKRKLSFRWTSARSAALVGVAFAIFVPIAVIGRALDIPDDSRILVGGVFSGLAAGYLMRRWADEDTAVVPPERERAT